MIVPIIAKYTKQPADVQDYDIDFQTEFLSGLGDAAPGPAGLVVLADAGINLDTYSLNNGLVKVWVSGGTDGTSYKVTVTLTSFAGRVKQVEFVIKVKET